MKATEFLESLAELKKQYPSPVSHVRALNDLMYYHTTQPPVFTNEQRQVFVENIDKLSEFLESDEGAIAVELLVDAFNCFVEHQELEIEEEEESEEPE